MWGMVLKGESLLDDWQYQWCVFCYNDSSCQVLCLLCSNMQQSLHVSPCCTVYNVLLDLPELVQLVLNQNFSYFIGLTDKLVFGIVSHPVSKIWWQRSNKFCMVSEIPFWCRKKIVDYHHNYHQPEHPESVAREYASSPDIWNPRDCVPLLCVWLKCVTCAELLYVMLPVLCLPGHLSQPAMVNTTGCFK